MKTTIELACEAGDDWDSTLSTDKEFLKRFEALVRADERKQVALDKKAENARELGLDYEPAPVQPGRNHYEDGDVFERIAAMKKPAAQPAVPDAFGTREGEHPEYIQGWNDCRAETLKMRKL